MPVREQHSVHTGPGHYTVCVVFLAHSSGVQLLMRLWASAVESSPATATSQRELSEQEGAVTWRAKGSREQNPRPGEGARVTSDSVGCELLYQLVMMKRCKVWMNLKSLRVKPRHLSEDWAKLESQLPESFAEHQGMWHDCSESPFLIHSQTCLTLSLQSCQCFRRFFPPCCMYISTAVSFIEFHSVMTSLFFLFFFCGPTDRVLVLHFRFLSCLSGSSTLLTKNNNKHPLSQPCCL